MEDPGHFNNWTNYSFLWHAEDWEKACRKIGKCMSQQVTDPFCTFSYDAIQQFTDPFLTKFPCLCLYFVPFPSRQNQSHKTGNVDKNQENLLPDQKYKNCQKLPHKLSFLDKVKQIQPNQSNDKINWIVEFRCSSNDHRYLIIEQR